MSFRDDKKACQRRSGPLTCGLVQSIVSRFDALFPPSGSDEMKTRHQLPVSCIYSYYKLLTCMQLPCPVLSSNHVFVLPRQRILCWNLAATTVVVCYGYGGQRQNAASVSHPRQTLNR